jgi:hypothetical protein
MECILDKKTRSPKPPEFILLNECAQVFIGLRKGYPAFSDNWDEAKPLQHPDQIKHLKYLTSYKLEIHYI